MGRDKRCERRQDEQEKSKVGNPRGKTGTWGTRPLPSIIYRTGQYFEAQRALFGSGAVAPADMGPQLNIPVAPKTGRLGLQTGIS